MKIKSIQKIQIAMRSRLHSESDIRVPILLSWEEKEISQCNLSLQYLNNQLKTQQYLMCHLLLMNLLHLKEVSLTILLKLCNSICNNKCYSMVVLTYIAANQATTRINQRFLDRAMRLFRVEVLYCKRTVIQAARPFFLNLMQTRFSHPKTHQTAHTIGKETKSLP